LEGSLPKLILVRHGDTELNSAERYWGHSDVKLSAAGLSQAERLRDRLATEKIAAVYSSDLQRALVTAEIIASKHRLAVITCVELREVNFGKLEGLTFAEVNQLYPEVTRFWFGEVSELQYPGGESFSGLNNRVSNFISRLKKHNSEETILIVAHSGPLRIIVCHLLGVDIRHWRQFHLELASFSILDTYPQGAILILFNDVSHLKQT